MRTTIYKSEDAIKKRHYNKKDLINGVLIKCPECGRLDKFDNSTVFMESCGFHAYAPVTIELGKKYHSCKCSGLTFSILEEQRVKENY